MSIVPFDVHEELAIPFTGEIVSLSDAAAMARALEDIRDIESQFRAIKTTFSLAFQVLAATAGTKTIELTDGRKAVVSGGKEMSYDAEQLEIGLRDAGMPEARIREIVELTYTYRVKAVEAKRAAAANPVYADILAMCSTETETPTRVSIRRS